MDSFETVDPTIVRAVATELKQYMKKEGRERGFDTSISKQVGSFSHSTGGSFYYNAHLDKHLRSHLNNPIMREHLKASRLAPGGGGVSCNEKKPRNVRLGPRHLSEASGVSLAMHNEKRMIDTVSYLLAATTRVTHPRDNGSGRRESLSSSSTPLWSPCSSCPPTPLQSLSRSTSQVSISATSTMSKSEHLHPLNNAYGQEDLQPPDNEPPSQLPISSEATHLPTNVSGEQREVSSPQLSTYLLSNTGVGSVDNSTHGDTLAVRRASQSHQSTQSSTQSTQTVGNKGVQVVLGQSISRGVATLGVEDHATQTAQDEGTQTDLSHLMNQFYLKHMEETGLKEVHQPALTHMVEHVDCSTANTATFEPGASNSPLSVECDKERQLPQNRQATENHELLEACRLGNVVSVENILRQHRAEEMNPHTYTVNPFDEMLRDVLVLFQNITTNYSDGSGMTGLHCAASNGHLRVIQVFVDAGLGLDVRSGSDKTALHYAALNGHLQCCQKLLDAGCDPSLRDSYNQTPLMLAKKLGYNDIVSLLEQ